MATSFHSPLKHVGLRGWPLVVAAGVIGLAWLIDSTRAPAGAAPAPAAAEPRKEDPGREPKQADPKKEDPREAGRPGNPVDRFEWQRELNPLLEQLPGANAEELKRLREQMQRAQQDVLQAQREILKAMEAARRTDAGRLDLPWPGLFPRRRAVALEVIRLGAEVAKPGATLVEQLDLPRGQGLILEKVLPDSPAAKAGLKAHDIVLEIGGKPVTSNIEDLGNQLADIKPNMPVDVVVLRKGKKETVKGLSLPDVKRPARPAVELPGGFFLNSFPDIGLQLQIQGQPRTSISIAVKRNADSFNIRRQDGDVSIKIAGTIAEGKATPSEIVIEEGGDSVKCKTLEKVPERYRETVKKMLDSVVSGGREK